MSCSFISRANTAQCLTQCLTQMKSSLNDNYYRTAWGLALPSSILLQYLAKGWTQAETNCREGRGATTSGSGTCHYEKSLLQAVPGWRAWRGASLCCIHRAQGEQATAQESQGRAQEMQAAAEEEEIRGHVWWHMACEQLTWIPSLRAIPLCIFLSTWTCFFNLLLRIFSSHRSSKLMRGCQGMMLLGCEGVSWGTSSVKMEGRVHATLSVVENGLWTGSMWKAFWRWEQLGFLPWCSSHRIWFWRAERRTYQMGTVSFLLFSFFGYYPIFGLIPKIQIPVKYFVHSNFGKGED